jgi:hypothetical protein
MDSEARRALKRIRIPVAVDVTALVLGAAFFLLGAWQLAAGRLGDGAALTVLAAATTLVGGASLARKRSASGSG